MSYFGLFVQLPEQDELLWDDGSATPEYCLGPISIGWEGTPLHPHFSALGYLL